MKLLKLSIDCEGGFRSLQQGFEINFHDIDDTEALSHFRPFCFAGLNGSGKSNVLEALANIFYHLELCVAKYLPDVLKDQASFSRSRCVPDAFNIEYLISQDNESYSVDNFHKVRIVKESDKDPQMFILPYSFINKAEEGEVSLIPPKSRESAATGKVYLPDNIIGYSSGENEILSIPFRRGRLINFDKYQEDYNRGYKFEEPENSMIYIDEEMSQAVLLACLLYEDQNALKPLNVELGITGMQSFRIVLKSFETKRTNKFDKEPRYLNHIINIINQLKQISTCYFEEIPSKVSLGNNRISESTQFICLDFFVDDQIKKSFKSIFPTSFDLFRFFQVLYELNLYPIDERNKSDIYNSNGVYTDYKLPKSSQKDTAFYFEDYYVLKTIKSEEIPKPLLLREFSDGEHQFLHTMGICLMLKNRRSLLLLDEPETHFNPSWRAKFIKILNDSINASKDPERENVNIHLMKDILLTSHSPFIISDCLPDNVILFEKNKEGDTLARKVSEMDGSFNTFGSSVQLIMNKLFNYKQSIGDHSFDMIKKIGEDKIENLEQATENYENLLDFGDSLEKDFVKIKIKSIIQKLGSK